MNKCIVSRELSCILNLILKLLQSWENIRKHAVTALATYSTNKIDPVGRDLFIINNIFKKLNVDHINMKDDAKDGDIDISEIPEDCMITELVKIIASNIEMDSTRSSENHDNLWALATEQINSLGLPRSVDFWKKVGLFLFF